MICIINHGLGNFYSVQSACEYLGFKTVLTNSEKAIVDPEKIIIPGVGNFGEAMNNLKKLKLVDTLNKEVKIKKKKILGICLGCQLILESSEESPNIKGFGWIKGYCKQFPDKRENPSPHVGWNDVIFKKKAISDFSEINEIKMYFNHSYYPVLENREFILSETEYSVRFTSIFRKENIFGVQPHPEKSQKNGLNFLKYFLDL